MHWREDLPCFFKWNVDLFLAMCKCVTPLSLDRKRRIPKTCLWQVKYRLMACTFSRILVYN